MKTSASAWLIALVAIVLAPSCATTNRLAARYKYRNDFHLPKAQNSSSIAKTTVNKAKETAKTEPQTGFIALEQDIQEPDAVASTQLSGHQQKAHTTSKSHKGLRAQRQIERVEEQFYRIKKLYATPQDYGPTVSRKTPGSAVAGFVCSLVGILVFGIILGILGIIFSVIALNKISKDPLRYKGKGLATAGLVIGIVVTVLSVIGLLILAGSV